MGKNKKNVSNVVGAYPTCNACGSRNAVWDAWAEWNIAIKSKKPKPVLKHYICDKCGKDTEVVWELDLEFRKKCIRFLNDALRSGERDNSTVLITSGLKALGDKFIEAACFAVATFDQFSEDNDPYQEHDFGAIDLQGEKLFWKIDTYDQSMSMLSPDPANPKITHRVLTIMLASEY
ncbi:MAG: DUF3768 domain-containing protein [Rhizobiales bacterium]|nr:DUF3768 domain-containing protein [Hyphomicrobiales bacterium]NRB15094.1 DUF3768 domain-containing protein [Hyphomicrobiales bacterium]